MQPPPVKSDTPEVWPLIIAELRESERTGAMRRLREACEARDAFGRAKYGVGLQVENGRSPLHDALDEALDAMAYTRQHYEQVRAKNLMTPFPSAAHRHIPRDEVDAIRLHHAARALALDIIAALSS